MLSQLEMVRAQPGTQYSGSGSHQPEGLTGPRRGEEKMVKEKNAEIITRLLAEMTSKKQSPAPDMQSCLKPFCGFFETVKTVFSDYRMNLYSLIANGDCVTACYQIVGTNPKLLNEAPSVPAMTINGIDIFHLKDGKIVDYTDVNHQMKIQPRIF